MDAVNVALQVAFILIFVVVLVRYLRQPREVHRDLVLVFGCVVALFAIQIATRLLPTLPRGISQLSTVILLLQPFLTLRLAGHFVPVSRQVAGVALAWFATAVVAVIIGTRGNPALTLFVVAYFVAVEGIAAAFLLRSQPLSRRLCPDAAADRVRGDVPVRGRHPRRGRRVGRGDRWRDRGPEHPRAGPAADARGGDRLPGRLPAADGAPPPPAAGGCVRPGSDPPRLAARRRPGPDLGRPRPIGADGDERVGQRGRARRAVRSSGSSAASRPAGLPSASRTSAQRGTTSTAAPGRRSPSRSNRSWRGRAG